MLLDKEALQKILDIIKKRHNLFAYKIGLREQLSDDDIRDLVKEYGAEGLHQIQKFMSDAYYAGYIRSKDFKTTPHTIVSHETFANASKPVLNDLQKYSIEHSNEVLNGYIQGLSSQAATAMTQLVQSYNNAYKNQLMTKVGVPMSIINEQANRSVGELATAMKDVAGQVSRDWGRVSRTETTNAINIGMTDRIVKQNSDRNPNEILVMKRVVNDAALCKHCFRLHLMPDGVTPRVYTLEEVLGNGTNIGRKANDWEMTIGAVHPNCRCSLIYLPEGYWFSPTGEMTFVGTDKAKQAYDNQRLI